MTRIERILLFLCMAAVLALQFLTLSQPRKESITVQTILPEPDKPFKAWLP